MENNIFFGGEDIVLIVKKAATERQIEILKKMYPGATILIEVLNEKVSTTSWSKIQDFETKYEQEN